MLYAIASKIAWQNHFFSIEDLLILVINLWIIWFPFDIVESLRLKYLKITSVHMFKCNRELKTRKKRQH